MGKVHDGYFLSGTQVEHIPDRLRMVEHPEQASHNIPDVAKAPPLVSISIYRESTTGHGLSRQARDDHPISGALSGTHGVEEAHNNRG